MMDEGMYQNARESNYENCQIGVGAPDVVIIRHHAVVTTQPSNNNTLQLSEPDNESTKRGSSSVNRGDDAVRTEMGGPKTGHSSKARYDVNDAALKRDRRSVLGPRLTGTSVGSSDSSEQTNREWASDLYFSINGKPHIRSCKDKALRASKDCGSLTCMMCNIAARLGDPQYLPFVPCTGPAIRFKVRILGGISGTICNDCLVTTFCWPCAVCQMHREMDDIGL